MGESKRKIFILPMYIFFYVIVVAVANFSVRYVYAITLMFHSTHLRGLKWNLKAEINASWNRSTENKQRYDVRYAH